MLPLSTRRVSSSSPYRTNTDLQNFTMYRISSQGISCETDILSAPSHIWWSLFPARTISGGHYFQIHYLLTSKDYFHHLVEDCSKVNSITRPIQSILKDHSI